MRVPDLGEARVWRLALAVLFLLAVFLRLGLVMELGRHYALRQHEWRGSLSYHMTALANRIVAGDTALRTGAPHLTQSMLEQRRPQAWIALNASRLPRGAGMLYPLAASLAATGGESVGPYIVLSILVGAATAVLAALLGEALSGRGAGLLAGLVVALSSSLASASVRVGPWVWEAFFLAAVLLSSVRALRNRAEPGEWATLGILCGLAIWFRSAFWWAPVLVALGAFRGGRPTAGALVALAVPLLLSGGGLAARNAHVGAPPLPAVGASAFDIAKNWNPAAVPTPLLAAPPLALEASAANPLRLAALMAGSGAVRAAFPRILHWRVRQFAGARDEPADLSDAYVRRRSGWLRFGALASDTVMALGWAGVIALAVRRRLPLPLAAALAVVALHTVTLTPWGEDRLPAQVLLAVAGAVAFVRAWERRGEAPVGPWAFVALWAGMHLLLQLDDRERGLRYRWEDFRNANIFLAQNGEREAAFYEIDDWDARELYERDHDPHQRLSVRAVWPR
jgi:hypothetical protein